MVAVQIGSLEAVQLLLTNEIIKENIDSTKPNGWTALMIAAKQQSIAMVEELIKAGANVFATVNQDHGLATVTLLDCCKGSKKIVQIIRQAQLFAAIRTGNLSQLSSVISDSDEEKETDISHIKIDLNAANAEGDTALMVAARLRNANAVQMLIEAGADVFENGSVVLQQAGDCLVTKNTIRQAQLFVAIVKGDLKVVTEIVNNEECVSLLTKCDNQGNTALMLAIQQALDDDDAAFNILKVLITAINKNLNDETKQNLINTANHQGEVVSQLVENANVGVITLFSTLNEVVDKDSVELDKLIVNSLENPVSEQPIKTTNTKKIVIGGAAGATASAAVVLATLIVVTAASIPPVLFTLTVVGIAAAGGFLVGAGITYAAIKIHHFFKERSVSTKSEEGLVESLLADERQFEEYNSPGVCIV